MSRRSKSSDPVLSLDSQSHTGTRVIVPVVKVLPGGSSGGFAGPGRAPGEVRRARGAIRGWSAGASRRNTAFLWSVQTDLLAGLDGFAFTLTLERTPPTSEEWHALRKAFHMRMVRAGSELTHWVVEWTKIGRPHLHMAVYSDGVDLVPRALVAWVEVCAAKGYAVSVRSQHLVPIEGVAGWLEYLAKHASRGANHYQRQGAPEGWERTGRLWGTSGEWPVLEPVEWPMTDAAFWRYRRLHRSYQRAKYRRLGHYRAMRTVGRNYGDPDGGRRMGVSGWIPEDVSLSLLSLASEGHWVPGHLT